jgi:hypothetical protein
MKSRILTTAAIFAALMFVANVSAADKYYYHGQGTPQPWSYDSSQGTCYWFSDAGHTTQTTKPSSSDVALIESNCYVDEDANCVSFAVSSSKYLILENGSGTGYTLRVFGSGTSTIDPNATVQLTQSGSVLQFLDSHTVSGDGKIEGSDPSAEIQIGNAATARTLTSTTTIEGTLKIEPGDNATATMTFFNNGTVKANGTEDGDVLDVNPDVLGGSGKWWVTTDPDAELQFTKGSTSLTGEFEVNNGTLDVLDNVETTDDLTFDGGEIHVAANKRFVANK